MSWDKYLLIPSRVVVESCVLEHKKNELDKHKLTCEKMNNWWPFLGNYNVCMNEYAQKSERYEQIVKYASGEKLTPIMEDALPKISASSAAEIDYKRLIVSEYLGNEEIEGFKIWDAIKEYHKTANNAMKYNY